jgi:hypothetical protein
VKKIVNISIFFVMASFAAFAHGQCSVGNGVQFCSPTNGAATGTSPTVSAAGAGNIVAMKLYVDGQDPAAATAHAPSLTTSLNLSGGQHNLTIVGWDNPGNVYQSSITVSAGASNSSPAQAGPCGANGTGVTVCSPGNGSSLGSPVEIKAAAAAGGGIAAMKIYVDDQDSYTIQSNSLDTALGMGSGSHNVVVQAWDNYGNVYKSSVVVNVSGGSAPAPAPTPISVTAQSAGACGVSSTGVTVCAPMNGANTGSPVQITAGAAAGSGIAAMKVYIDNQDSYTIQSNSINTALPIGAGSHYVVVQAWDNSGNVYKTPVNISVGGGSTPSAPAPCGTTTGVQFCTPTNGGAASGSVSVTAAGAGNIVAMKLYVDGQDPAAFGTSTNSLSTTVSLSSGGHNLAVNGWDNAGNVYQASINVNGAGVPTNPNPGTGGSVPAPPANAIVYNNIQNQNGWQSCGACGNQGGAGSAPGYGMSQGISNPSLSGNATDFYINDSTPYTGGYNFIEQPTVPNPVTYLKYEFDLYIPSQFSSTPQALEWECQQNANGYTYNFAFQADYGSGDWRVFNYTTKNWEDTGIRFGGFTPGTWHHVISMFHASGTQTVHDSITVDGVTHPVNITHQALYTGNGLEFTNAFQQDLNVNGSGYQVYVDNMKVTLAN